MDLRMKELTAVATQLCSSLPLLLAFTCYLNRNPVTQSHLSSSTSINSQSKDSGTATFTLVNADSDIQNLRVCLCDITEYFIFIDAALADEKGDGTPEVKGDGEVTATAKLKSDSTVESHPAVTSIISCNATIPSAAILNNENYQCQNAAMKRSEDRSNNTIEKQINNISVSTVTTEDIRVTSSSQPTSISISNSARLRRMKTNSLNIFQNHLTEILMSILEESDLNPYFHNILTTQSNIVAQTWKYWTIDLNRHLSSRGETGKNTTNPNLRKIIKKNLSLFDTLASNKTD